jgi:glycine cleavage system H protein
VGITDFAQDQLGDIVHLELPEVGRALAAGQAFGVVESVKAVSDLYVPLEGTVVEVNSALNDTPELVNSAPYGDGWMIRIRLMDPANREGLLSADEYRRSRPGVS